MTQTWGNKRETESVCVSVGEEDEERLSISKIKGRKNVSERLSPSSGKRLSLERIGKIN